MEDYIKKELESKGFGVDNVQHKYNDTYIVHGHNRGLRIKVDTNKNIRVKNIRHDIDEDLDSVVDYINYTRRHFKIDQILK